MKRSTDRILTTHVGSLVRPVKIREFMAAMEGGKPYDKAEFEATLKREVAGVVKQQADTGLDIVSDGEFGKISWFGYLEERLGGLTLRDIKPDEYVPSIRSIAPEVKDFPEFYEAYFPIMVYDWLPPGESKTRLPAPPLPRDQKVWDFSGPVSYTGQAAIRFPGIC